MENTLMDSLRNTDIEELQLSVKTFNALIKAGLISLQDVCRAIDNKTIWAVRNLGPKSLKEVTILTKQYLGTFGTSIGEIAHNVPSIPRNSTVIEAVKEEYPDIQIGSDLPITSITDFLGAKLVEDLQSIGITKLSDLDNLVVRYLNYLLPGSQLIDKTIKILVREVRQLIANGSLCPSIPIDSTTLADLLNVGNLGIDKKKSRIELLRRILAKNSLTHEINSLMLCLTDKQKRVFIDYSLNKLSLEAIRKNLMEQVSSQRVSQILTQSMTKLRKHLNAGLNVYMLTSLQLADELGMSLSRETWKSQLIDRKILIDSDRDYQSFDLFCALIKNKYTCQSIPDVPKNVEWIVNNKRDFPICVLTALSEVTKKELKEIKRIIKTTGGISLPHAEKILEFNSQETSGILIASGFNEVYPGWYSMTECEELTQKTPILRAGLIILQVCGPIAFESFYDGLKTYVSRQNEVLAPKEVIIYLFRKFGFIIQNNIITHEGFEKIEFSELDYIYIELLQKRGVVLSLLDIVEHYLKRGYAYPYPNLQAFGESLVIEKVEKGLYKLRGSEVTWQDIENAKSRQEGYSRNAKVVYGSDGIIRYELTLGSCPEEGLLSISRSCQPLPDFNEGWPIYITNKKLGTARRNEYFIWGLSLTFTQLGVKIGDRIELAFDTRNKPRIKVRVIQQNENIS